jgi:hypothetical protein
VSGEPSSFREKALTIGVIGRRSGNVVSDGVNASGERYKATTDELGNTVTEYNSRQDVTIRPHPIVCSL